MPYNPFGSFRNVFDPMEGDALSPNRKRFLSSVFPMPSRQITTPPLLPPPKSRAPLMPPPQQIEAANLGDLGQGDVGQDDGRSQGSQYFDEMENIRTRRGPALSAYQKHLEGIPTREKFKPGIGRRIAAGLVAGASSLGGRQGINPQALLYAPYERAVGDWGMKAQGLGESARLEREEVEGQLKALSEARSLGLDYDEYELKRLQTMSKIGLDARAQSTRERIADLTQQRDRATDARERTRIQGLIDYQQGQLGVGKRRAASEERRAATGEANQKSLANYRTARLEQLARSSGASPVELGKAMENALLLLGRDPDFADFIDTSSYPPVVKDPRGYFGGPSQEQYEAFNRRLREAIESQISEGKLLTGDEGEDFGDEDFEIGEPEF